MINGFREQLMLYKTIFNNASYSIFNRRSKVPLPYDYLTLTVSVLIAIYTSPSLARFSPGGV